MSEFVNTIDLLGDDVVIDSIIDRSITEFKDDVITVVGTRAFNNCKNLLSVIMPNVTNLAQECFRETGLKYLVLSNEKMCTLDNTSVLLDTSIASGTGHIYVPSALIEDYKAATNWSTYADQFRALEDYTVDGTTTGELDESKI